MNRSDVETWYREFQAAFVLGIESIDPAASFASDVWEREGGGGGDTRVLSEGRHIEKAVVNFSAVFGDTPTALSERMAAAGKRFYATGVSIIVHPRNPHAPTFHANLRYFESDSGASWFGGGTDLTPYYLYDEDAQDFHRIQRMVCDLHKVADYEAFKRACDEYFYLPHRGEARGVGGVFFDHMTEPLDEAWSFQRDLGEHFLPTYIPILQRRVTTPFGDAERHWHEVRRGRYVEFNLVWDRGTKFGLETGGRTESILGSLPPRARWEYAHTPKPGSPEARLLGLLQSEPRQWA